MDILKFLSNPNLLSTAGTTKATAFDPVQSNNIITPGNGYSKYSDEQVKNAKDEAYRVLNAPAKQPIETVQTMSLLGDNQSGGYKDPAWLDRSLLDRVVPLPPIQSPAQQTYTPMIDNSSTVRQSEMVNTPTYSYPQTNITSSVAQTTPTQTNGNELYDKRKELFYQMMSGKANNSGIYDRSGFTQYSPDQINSMNNSADRFYQNEFNDIQGKIDKFEKEQADSNDITPMTLNGQTYALSKQQLKTMNVLNPQFEQLIKEPMGVIKASQNIDGLAEIASASSAAAQMAMIFSFMKSLDPSSTVREGEYANAENTRGVPDTIRNWYNKAKDGTFLTKEQVDNFAVVSQKQATTARQQIRATASDFDVKAGFNGLPSGLFAAQIANRVGEINSFSGTTSGMPANLVDLSSKNPIMDINDWKNRIANNESLGATDINGRKPGEAGYSQYAVRSKAGTQRKDKNGNSYIDYAYGKYQFMGDFIPQWSREALGVTMTPQQLMQNPDAQEKIMDYLGMKSYQKYGNWDDATAVHFSGKPVSGNNAQDAYGTSVPEYLINMYTNKNVNPNTNMANNTGYTNKLKNGMGFNFITQ